MKSIKNTVSINLLYGFIFTALLSIAVCVWLGHSSYLSALDKQLNTTARIALALGPGKARKNESANLPPADMQVQIFNYENDLLFKSRLMPQSPVIDTNGSTYQSVNIDGQYWRAYHLKDEEQQHIIIVATKLETQFYHASSTWIGITILTLLTLALLTLLMFITLRSIFKPLFKLSEEISNRASAKLQAINYRQYPHELRGMLKELNLLFSRVRHDFDRNKRFSADAAHELRTPLTALKTQAQLALEMSDPHEQKKAIQNVLISVNRSIHAVQQLLTLSRLDHEEKLNDVMDINIETISAEIIAFMYPQALEKQIEIELCNKCTSLPIIRGNDAALGIMLRNLIDNAIRYTPNQGKVLVSIIENSKGVMLQVSDTGPGILEEYHEKAFDRFFRVLGTKQTGSGLGLAIVKQIIDLHKAKITLGKPADHEGLLVTILYKRPHK